MKLYFSRSEILMGREKQAPLTPEMDQNLNQLIKALSVVRAAYGSPMHVSSGYRPASINAAVGGSKKSAHQDCQAADIIDEDGLLANWVMNNLDILEQAGLYLEDPRYTMVINKDNKVKVQWVHLQLRPTSRRVFIPYSGIIKLKEV
tara:strand:- start:1470 stop:1910 length:441 start_codon:yes stop_codon:yes gene_type:complete